MNITKAKQSTLETITTITHDSFILKYSDLDNYCRIYEGKVLVKDLLHEYIIVVREVTDDYLKGILETEIELYNNVIKMRK